MLKKLCILLVFCKLEVSNYLIYIYAQLTCNIRKISGHLKQNAGD